MRKVARLRTLGTGYKQGNQGLLGEWLRTDDLWGVRCMFPIFRAPRCFAVAGHRARLRTGDFAVVGPPLLCNAKGFQKEEFAGLHGLDLM